MPGYLEFSSVELVRACAGSNDESAWKEFIRRFRPVIANAVQRIASQWGEPSGSLEDDLFQDICFKLCDNHYRLLRSFEPRHEDSIYGFLKVVTANVVHDHFKSAKAAKRGMSQTDPLEESEHSAEESSDSDSFELVSRRLQLEKVEKILNQVTAGKDQERKRIIFWLRYRQGFTASEIAAIPWVDLTTEGVESMLMRLLLAVRCHFVSSSPHREVKVLKRKNRSIRVGS